MNAGKLDVAVEDVDLAAVRMREGADAFDSDSGPGRMVTGARIGTTPKTARKRRPLRVRAIQMKVNLRQIQEKCPVTRLSSGEVVAPELHDKAKFAFAKHRFDRAHDPELAADPDPFADLEPLLTAQMAGCDHLIAATQLIPVVRHRHSSLFERVNAVRQALIRSIAKRKVRFDHGSARASAQPPPGSARPPCQRTRRTKQQGVREQHKRLLEQRSHAISHIARHRDETRPPAEDRPISDAGKRSALPAGARSSRPASSPR